MITSITYKCRSKNHKIKHLKLIPIRPCGKPSTAFCIGVFLGVCMITQKRLKELYYYESGKLIRRIPGHATRIGNVLGCLYVRGYVIGSVDLKRYSVHKLIYLYHHGFTPQYIDHINNIKNDNRIENLRIATSQQNSYNRKPHGPSKYKGVHWHKRSKKWQAMIQGTDRNRIYLGSFNHEKEAALAYDKEARKIHGDFYREPVV